MSGVLRTVVVVMDRKIAQERVRATIICKIFYAIGVIVVGKSPGVAPPQPFRVEAVMLLDFLFFPFFVPTEERVPLFSGDARLNELPLVGS